MTVPEMMSTRQQSPTKSLISIFFKGWNQNLYTKRALGNKGNITLLYHAPPRKFNTKNIYLYQSQVLINLYSQVQKASMLKSICLSLYTQQWMITHFEVKSLECKVHSAFWLHLNHFLFQKPCSQNICSACLKCWVWTLKYLFLRRYCPHCIVYKRVKSAGEADRWRGTSA